MIPLIFVASGSLSRPQVWQRQGLYTSGGRDKGLRLDPNKDFAIHFIVFATWFANDSIDFRGFGQPVSTTGCGKDRAFRLYPNVNFAFDFLCLLHGSR